MTLVGSSGMSCGKCAEWGIEICALLRIEERVAFLVFRHGWRKVHLNGDVFVGAVVVSPVTEYRVAMVFVFNGTGGCVG